jgi:protein TonB
MGHAIARAGSLGASAVLMGAAVLLALTMTYTVQEIGIRAGPDIIVAAPEPPPPPPPEPVTTQTHTQPIAGPTIPAELPPIPVDAGAEPMAYQGPVVGPAGPIVITSPHWRDRPHNLQRYYPPRALARNVEGEVLLDCLVRVSGLLNCTVVSESPRGWGFAEAAQRIAGAHQMAPATREGVSVEGRYAMRVPFEID